MSLRNITSLIEKGNFLQVLKENNLSQATKSANPKIVQFFAQHTVDLLNLALKTNQDSDPDSKSLQRSALVVLTSTSSPLQKAIVQIPEFYEELSAFMAKDTFESRISGNFCQIIYALSQTNPEENFKPLPQLCSFLIEHIDILAFSELFITLNVECFSFKVTDEQLLLLSSKCAGPNGLYAISTISSILKQRSEQFVLFNSLPVIQNLLKSASCKENPPSVTASILTIILLIIRKNKEATNVQSKRAFATPSPQELEEMQSKLNIILEEIERPETFQLFTHILEEYNVATPIAILLFNYLNPFLLTLYLQHPLDGTFGVSILYCLQKIFSSGCSEKIENTIKILNESGFLKGLMEIFINHKGAGASMEIIRLLEDLPGEIKDKIEFTQSNEWKEFVSGLFKQRLALNQENYGERKTYPPDANPGPSIADTINLKDII